MKIFYSSDLMNISIQIEKKKVAHVSGIDVSIHLQSEKRTSPAFIVFFFRWKIRYTNIQSYPSPPILIDFYFSYINISTFFIIISIKYLFFLVFFDGVTLIK